MTRGIRVEVHDLFNAMYEKGLIKCQRPIRICSESKDV